MDADLNAEADERLHVLNRIRMQLLALCKAKKSYRIGLESALEVALLQ